MSEAKYTLITPYPSLPGDWMAGDTVEARGPFFVNSRPEATHKPIYLNELERSSFFWKKENGEDNKASNDLVMLTEDGQGLRIGDHYWEVWKDREIKRYVQVTGLDRDPGYRKKRSIKAFYSRAAANNHIFRRIGILSIEEVLKVLGMDNFTYTQTVELLNIIETKTGLKYNYGKERV